MDFEQVGDGRPSLSAGQSENAPLVPRSAARARWICDRTRHGGAFLPIALCMAACTGTEPGLRPRVPIGYTVSAEPRDEPPAQQPPLPDSTAPSRPIRARDQIGRGKLCDLPDTPVEALVFATNDIGLRRREKRILEDIVACVRVGVLRDGSLVVTGYADACGDEADNRELALARAREVELFLLRRGVSPAQISTAAGHAEPQVNTGPESWALEHRVEISWSHGSSGSPAQHSSGGRGSSEPCR